MTGRRPHDDHNYVGRREPGPRALVRSTDDDPRVSLRGGGGPGPSLSLNRHRHPRLAQTLGLLQPWSPRELDEATAAIAICIRVSALTPQIIRRVRGSPDTEWETQRPPVGAPRVELSRLKRCTTLGAGQRLLLVSSLDRIEDRVAPHAARGARPVSAAGQDNKGLVALLNVLPADRALSIALMLDRVEAWQLLLVRWLPGERHVATRGGHKLLALGGARRCGRATLRRSRCRRYRRPWLRDAHHNPYLERAARHDCRCVG